MPAAIGGLRHAAHAKARAWHGIHSEIHRLGGALSGPAYSGQEASGRIRGRRTVFTADGRRIRTPPGAPVHPRPFTRGVRVAPPQRS